MIVNTTRIWPKGNLVGVVELLCRVGKLTVGHDPMTLAKPLIFTQRLQRVLKRDRSLS